MNRLEALNCQELHDEQQRRIDTDHCSGTQLMHAQCVIAVAATDIQYVATVQWSNEILEPVPFEVASPLAVDRDTRNFERAFSPRRKCQQQVADFVPLVFVSCA